MARVEVSAAAAEDLARLRVTHRLPPDTSDRVKRSLRGLGRFPRLGTLLHGGGWDGFRFVLGPWRWMVIVYEHREADDVVVVVTIQDGRSSAAATAAR
jgi:plasmid stabilization system protein ParE